MPSQVQSRNNGEWCRCRCKWSLESRRIACPTDSKLEVLFRMTERDKVGAIRFSRSLAKRALGAVVRDSLSRSTAPKRRLGDAPFR
jgi:hypothetical protein